VKVSTLQLSLLPVLKSSVYCLRRNTEQQFCALSSLCVDHILYIWQILEKKWEYNGTVHQLFIDFKKAYDSVRREVLYNIPIEFGIPRKLVGLIQMCLNETYRTVCIGKYQSDKFPVQNGLKQGDALSPLLFNFA
jgi:hypothetical protein